MPFTLNNITLSGVNFARITDQLYKWENKYFIKQWYAKQPNQYTVLNKITNQSTTIAI